MQCPNCPTCTHNCCTNLDATTAPAFCWIDLLNITQEQYDAMIIARDAYTCPDRACEMLRLVDGWLQCFPQYYFGYAHKPLCCQQWICLLANPPE